MRIVRFQVGHRMAYGVWEGENVREIHGSIFGDFTLEQVTPSHPAHFLKPLTTLIGPEEPIVIPRVATQVDYEGEPAAVIKRALKDASLEEASAAVLGYTCLNDVTERPCLPSRWEDGWESIGFSEWF